MPDSKFIVRVIPISSGLMKCTCGQMIKYETEREEKMKLRMHLKVCANPPEGWDDSWPSRKCRTLEASQKYQNDRHRQLYS